MPTPSTITSHETQSTSAPTFHEWAKVELMGRQVVVGLVSETTMAGGSFLRVDVPAREDQPGFTRFYRPEAIYCLSPITEALATKLLDYYRPEPVQRYELPQIAEIVHLPQECDTAHENEEPDDEF